MVAHLVNVHDRALCAGYPCCVHDPSAHHMRGWRQHWRVDRQLTERTCPHGVGHPDPDHLDYVRRTRGDAAAWADGVHGCDNCCWDDRDQHGGRDDGP